MATLKLWQITLFLALFSASIKAEKSSRKLDENTPGLDNKCGGCPCDNPCNPQPSQPPPSPSPPPPPPSPPPTPKYPPPSNNCPPPPAVPSGQKPPKGQNPPYLFINGPPGSVYPVYPYYSGGRRSSLIGKFPFLISFILWAVAS